MVCSPVEIKSVLMFIHVHFMLYMKRSVHVATLTEAIQWSVIKEPQNNVYCLNFYKNDKIWKLKVMRPCFIQEVTCSVLSVCVLSVYSLLCHVLFHCVRTWCVVWEQHCLLEIATVNKDGGSFSFWELWDKQSQLHFLLLTTPETSHIQVTNDHTHS